MWSFFFFYNSSLNIYIVILYYKWALFFFFFFTCWFTSVGRPAYSYEQGYIYNYMLMDTK